MRDRRTARRQPQRFRHLPTEVLGIPFDGSVSCASDIIEWAQGFTLDDYGRLCAFTSEGLRYVPEGNTAMLDVEGSPYSVRPSVMEACYVAVNGTYVAPLPAERVRALVAESRTTSDRDRLRQIIAQLGAHCEATQDG